MPAFATSAMLWKAGATLSTPFSQSALCSVCSLVHAGEERQQLRAAALTPPRDVRSGVRHHSRSVWQPCAGTSTRLAGFDVVTCVSLRHDQVALLALLTVLT